MIPLNTYQVSYLNPVSGNDPELLQKPAELNLRRPQTRVLTLVADIRNGILTNSIKTIQLVNYFLFTASLSALPALNLGATDAAIFIVAPV